MTMLTKRATIYIDPDLHKALRLKAIEMSQSVSAIVNDAVKRSLMDDEEDLAAFGKRAGEPLISFEDTLKELKRRGKI